MDKELILQSIGKAVSNNQEPVTVSMSLSNLDHLGFLETDYLKTFTEHPSLFVDSIILLAKKNLSLAYYYASTAVLAQLGEDQTGKTISLHNILTAQTNKTSRIEFIPNFLSVEVPVVLLKQRGEYLLCRISKNRLAMQPQMRLLGMNSLRFKVLEVDVKNIMRKLSLPEYRAIKNFTQFSFAVLFLGAMRSSLDYVQMYTAQRIQGGRALKNWPLVSQQMAQMESWLQSIEAGVHQISMDDDKKIAGLLKVSGERALDITSKCIDLLGGYGYMREYPVEGYYRGAHVLYALGVTSEV